MNKINNNKLITVLYMTDLVCLKEMTKFGHRIESANVGVKVVNYLYYTFQVVFVRVFHPNSYKINIYLLKIHRKLTKNNKTEYKILD